MKASFLFSPLFLFFVLQSMENTSNESFSIAIPKRFITYVPALQEIKKTFNSLAIPLPEDAETITILTVIPSKQFESSVLPFLQYVDTYAAEHNGTLPQMEDCVDTIQTNTHWDDDAIIAYFNGPHVYKIPLRNGSVKKAMYFALASSLMQSMTRPLVVQKKGDHIINNLNPHMQQKIIKTLKKIYSSGDRPLLFPENSSFCSEISSMQDFSFNQVMPHLAFAQGMTITIINTNTQKTVHTLTTPIIETCVHCNATICVERLPVISNIFYGDNGKSLITVSNAFHEINGSTVDFWDVPTYKHTRTLQFPAPCVDALLSFDQKLLGIKTDTGYLYIWDIAQKTYRYQTKLDNSADTMNNDDESLFAFSYLNKYLVTSQLHCIHNSPDCNHSACYYISIHSLNNNMPRTTYEIPLLGKPEIIRCSPHALHCAVIINDKIFLYDLKLKNVLRTIIPHTMQSTISSLGDFTFDPEVKNQYCIKTLSACALGSLASHNTYPLDLFDTLNSRYRYSPYGTFFAYIQKDKTLCLINTNRWAINSPHIKNNVINTGKQVIDSLFGPNNSLLLTIDNSTKHAYLTPFAALFGCNQHENLWKMPLKDIITWLSNREN